MKLLVEKKEVSVEFQGRLRTTLPLTYDKTNFASHSVVILSTVRVAICIVTEFLTEANQVHYLST